MPRIESPKKRLPFFVRLKTMADMKEVAKNLAEIKVEVVAMEKTRAELQGDNDEAQRAALAEIAVSSVTAAAKAEEIINRVLEIKAKLKKFQKQVETINAAN